MQGYGKNPYQGKDPTTGTWKNGYWYLTAHLIPQGELFGRKYVVGGGILKPTKPNTIWPGMDGQPASPTSIVGWTDYSNFNAKNFPRIAWKQSWGLPIGDGLQMQLCGRGTARIRYDSYDECDALYYFILADDPKRFPPALVVGQAMDVYTQNFSGHQTIRDYGSKNFKGDGVVVGESSIWRPDELATNSAYSSGCYAVHRLRLL
jgi:hypothetical protein